jgi:hypothetical protein
MLVPVTFVLHTTLVVTRAVSVTATLHVQGITLRFGTAMAPAYLNQDTPVPVPHPKLVPEQPRTADAPSRAFRALCVVLPCAASAASRNKRSPVPGAGLWLRESGPFYYPFQVL